MHSSIRHYFFCGMHFWTYLCALFTFTPVGDNKEHKVTNCLGKWNQICLYFKQATLGLLSSLCHLTWYNSAVSNRCLSLHKSNSPHVQHIKLVYYNFWRQYVDRYIHKMNNGVCRVLQNGKLKENIFFGLNNLWSKWVNYNYNSDNTWAVASKSTEWSDGEIAALFTPAISNDACNHITLLLINKLGDIF